MKTKIIITAMFFSLLTYSAFCQFNRLDTIHFKWSISASINSVEAQINQQLIDTWVLPTSSYYGYYGDKNDRSLSLSLIPKYQIVDDIILRFEIGVTNISLASHFNGIGDTVSQNQGMAFGSLNTTKDESIKQKIYRFAPGIQRSFMKKKRIESYVGSSLCYFYYNEMNWSDYVVDNTSTNNYSHYTSTTPGGFATGIGTFSGFNFSLRKGIAIGGEFSFFLLYYKLGGVQKGVTETPKAPPTNKLYWSIANNASKGIQVSKVIPSFHISVQL